MGDTTDTNAGDVKAAEGVAPADDKVAATADERMAARRGWWGRSWIGRHWRGELPLAEAFWINGILVSAVPEILFWAVVLLSSRGTGEIDVGFAEAMTLGAIVWRIPIAMIWSLSRLPMAINLVMASVLPVWQMVGIWRSAGHYPGERIWSIAARVLMVVWGFQLLNVYWMFLK